MISMESQTYTTMTTEDDAPEVGPNDIVIHLVNPFKCGMCELEFLEKSVFKDHIFNHLEQIKHERPSSQIVMNIVLPPETPGGVTVTRDILQLAEDGSIKQVIQPANSITLNQVLPLKELEAAGVLKLDHSQPPATPVTPAVPKITTPAVAPYQTPVTTKPVSVVPSSDRAMDNVSILDPAGPPFIKEEAEDVSEIIENTDGTFSVAFKGPNNEMQHIQIIRPEGMKGDMMLELTNSQQRRTSKGAKINECDICGKILSSSTNLLRHKMYHSSERPFVCQTCGKGFKDVSNLKKHTLIHNRIFPCHLCKKSFLRKSLLAMHLKRHQARTVFVKSGSGAKEVTLKTFVDDDGTRVEEMSMAALQGQTFEYKKRIMKADPSDMKPDLNKEIETSTASVATDSPKEGSLELKAELGQGQENGQMVSKFDLTDEDLLVKGEQQDLKKEKRIGEPVDDIPEMEVPDVPKEFVKMYQCGHCGKRTVQRGNMMRHLIHHLRDKPFKCEECPKQFVDKGELVKHIKTHTKPYRCNRCGGAFAHNVQLMKHQETECLGDKEQLNYSILDDGQTYRCDICQIEMKRLGNMIKHVSTHTGARVPRKHWSNTPKSKAVERTSKITAPYAYNAITRKFQCNHCNEIFNEKKDVHQHIRSEHVKEQVHQCTDCDSWFHTVEELKKHTAIHAKPFKCDLCQAMFTHKILLESHKRKHEEKDREEETADYGKAEDRSYYCKHCDKKLLKKFRMMNHIRRHLDKRPFECSDCNKCFSTQYMLSSHKKTHAKLFTCENCGEAFTRKLFLQIHRKKHEENVEEKQFESLQTTPASNYKRKFSQDSGDTPLEENSFSCKICSTPFSRLVIKLNHERKCKEESKVLVRLPTGDGFQCKICQKVATLKHNLMVHIRKNHDDIVKIDPNGLIHVPEEYLCPTDDISVEESDGESPKAKKPKINSSSSGDKKSLWDWDTKESNESSETAETIDKDNGDADEDSEKVLGDQFTKTTGGYACNVCRRKFTDLDATMTHFKSHHEEEKEEEKNDAKESQQPEEDEEKKKSTKEDDKPESVEKTPASVKDELKTPLKTAKLSKSKVSSSAKSESKTPNPNEASLSKKDSNAVSANATPSTSPSRSSSRPVRSQKIPSRFLE